MDVMVVLDLSGSMKQGDGANRYDGLFKWVKTFVGRHDRVGVVTLGTGARQISSLVTWDKLSFESLTSDLKIKDKYSDIAAGLETAYYRLKTDTPRGVEKVMVLFSDAKIDLPGGEWESRNSMRYLLESLYPSMRADNIRLIAIVPDGLTADFQLLQELSSGTGGAYFRGLPSDAAQVRAILSTGNSKAAPLVASTASAQAGSSTNLNVHAVNPAVGAGAPGYSAAIQPPSNGASMPGNEVVVERVIREGTASWMIALFLVFGVLILGMFGAVLYLLVNRKKGSAEAEEDDELESVLSEVHSLKQIAAKRSLSSAAAAAAFAEDEPLVSTPPAEELAEDLSVGFVTPFLEFENIKRQMDPHATDDIAVAPAFSPPKEVQSDPNLSISSMETLLGMAGVDVERERD
jgi:HPt (histidine-containing phosphotransfer) domain-containing protein